MLLERPSALRVNRELRDVAAGVFSVRQARLERQDALLGHLNLALDALVLPDQVFELAHSEGSAFLSLALLDEVMEVLALLLALQLPLLELLQGDTLLLLDELVEEDLLRLSCRRRRHWRDCKLLWAIRSKLLGVALARRDEFTRRLVDAL